MSVAQKTTKAPTKATKPEPRLQPATADQVDLQRQFHDAKAMAAPFIAAQNAAKALLVEAMEVANVDGFTLDGVEIVGMDETTTKDVDMAGLLAEFPGAVKYLGTKKGKRFNAKNPVPVIA